MPDIITHYRFGNDVLKHLPKEAGGYISRGIYDLATVGPDPWFSYRFWLPASLQKGKTNRGNVMHEEKTGAYLQYLLQLALEAKGEGRRELFSYFAGFVCHYRLDACAHPYIIYRTGNYRQTPDTLAYRGNHMRMERAIDAAMLSRWPEAGFRPIVNKILYMKRLPDCIREDFDLLYQKIYGWDHVSRDMDQCILYQRVFYYFMQEPTGILDKLLTGLDNGKSHNDLSTVTYYHKSREDLDVLNTQHRLWKNPWAPEITSTESFEDIIARAQKQALSILTAAWNQLNGGVEDAAPLIGNLSYSTGLDLKDPRRHNTPVFDPLPFKNTK